MKVHAAVFLGLVGAANGLTIADMIANDPRTNTFAAILKASGMSEVLAGPGPFTAFIPSDTAYQANWPDYQLKYVLDPATGAAKKFVEYATHSGALKTTDMTVGMNITTMNMLHPLTVTQADASQVHMFDATCGVGQSLQANMAADNGVLHVVDTVFQAPATICPDKIYAAEQRSEARISSYGGYECRSKKETRHLYETDNQKPLGMATDDDAQMVIWANDQDYPRRTPTSWVSAVDYNESNYHILNNKLIDPQGIAVDKTKQQVYIASHSGYGIVRINYDGTNLTTVYSQPNNLNFQPSDVALDVDEGLIFASVEGTDNTMGSLWQINMNGTNATQLVGGVIEAYGLCIDTHAKQVFHVQGGHGGSIKCYAYGSNPCVAATVVDTLEYPYMCDIDNAFAPYGGPTRIVWTEANRPGTIAYSFVNGSDPAALNVTVSTDLDAPMGVAFGCSPF